MIAIPIGYLLQVDQLNTERVTIGHWQLRDNQLIRREDVPEVEECARWLVIDQPRDLIVECRVWQYKSRARRRIELA